MEWAGPEVTQREVIFIEDIEKAALAPAEKSCRGTAMLSRKTDWEVVDATPRSAICHL